MKKIASSFLTLGLMIAVLYPSSEIFAQTVSLEEFDTLRVVQPNESFICYRYLWCHYGTGDLSGQNNAQGQATITSEEAKNGKNSLRIRLAGGNVLQTQTQFYTNNGVTWDFLRQFVEDPGKYPLNTFNRMRFWIKTPSNMRAWTGGRQNMNVGTYFRRSGSAGYSAEEGGSHYYHFFNIPPTGEWHQVIVDTHPTSTRTGEGCQGSTECGDRPYPTNEPGYGYFDLMTRFYIDLGGESARSSDFPADVYLDGFELYRETRPENIDQVYSLNGVYNPSNNEIYVGWSRRKDENSTRHEVRYSFQDIYTLPQQFNSATPAPNGTVSPLGWGGYNGMEYSTTGINVAGKSTIYVAIKPQNSNRFRQIAIPVSAASGSVLAPPRNLRIAQ